MRRNEKLALCWLFLKCGIAMSADKKEKSWHKFFANVEMLVFKQGKHEGGEAHEQRAARQKW